MIKVRACRYLANVRNEVNLSFVPRTRQPLLSSAKPWNNDRECRGSRGTASETIPRPSSSRVLVLSLALSASISLSLSPSLLFSAPIEHRFFLRFVALSFSSLRLRAARPFHELVVRLLCFSSPPFLIVVFFSRNVICGQILNLVQNYFSVDE